jgi:hypothetical protein
MHGEELKAVLATPEETQYFLDHVRQEKKKPVREIFSPFGVIKGWAEIKCREEKTGELVWEQTVDNIITDYGRRFWFETLWHATPMGTYINTEQPDYRRMSLNGPADATSIALSTNLTPSIDIGTGIKTYSTTFGLPGSTRLIGTVALASLSHANSGLYGIYSYLLLNPPKTQTTTQTLELVYKVSFTISV